MSGRLVVWAVVVGLAAAWTGRADPETAELARQKRDAARKTYEVTWTNYLEGRVPEELVYRWSKRWLRAEEALSARPDDRIAARTAHLQRMIELERLVRRLQPLRQVTVDVVSAVEYYRAEAELWLAEAKQADKKAP